MKIEKGNVTYLSVPYSWNPERGFEIANKVAARLMNDGYVIISPISHSHPISDHLDPKLKLDHEFWMKQDLNILSKCDQLMVVVINGDNQMIEDSRGCMEEIRFAKEKLINTYYYYYAD